MKDLLFRTLRHEETERAPWVPFAGVHAGKLKGYTATEMLTDADKAFESLMEVNRLYKPDGQPVIFDLQIEAECLGCDLTWADDCPPSVSGHPLDGSDEDMALIGTSDLLTLKKTIYVANLSESEGNEPESNRHYLAVKELAEAEGSQVLPICAKLEADIAELDDPEEKAMFMEELGVAESGLDRLIKASYTLLGLISFLTAGSDECRAWTIKKGTKAPQAAGKIHTDFERGFIRAEVIAFEDMKACGTMAAAKAKGLVRSEGKEYVMKDGDIVNFLFNV